jgi:hypothetical protein
MVSLIKANAKASGPDTINMLREFAADKQNDPAERLKAIQTIGYWGYGTPSVAMLVSIEMDRIAKRMGFADRKELRDVNGNPIFHPNGNYIRPPGVDDDP